VLEELFNDEGLKFTSQPEMTAAPAQSPPPLLSMQQQHRNANNAAASQLWQEVDAEEEEGLEGGAEDEYARSPRFETTEWCA
jgi:hypothetical protein